MWDISESYAKDSFMIQLGHKQLYRTWKCVEVYPAAVIYVFSFWVAIGRSLFLSCQNSAFANFSFVVIHIKLETEIMEAEKIFNSLNSFDLYMYATDHLGLNGLWCMRTTLNFVNVEIYRDVKITPVRMTTNLQDTIQFTYLAPNFFAAFTIPTDMQGLAREVPNKYRFS